MSQHFAKPETALKRAKELIGTGDKDASLTVLCTAMGNRRFKAQIGETMEKIAVLGLDLSVELRDLRTARDFLINYRGLTQTSNVASLEKVVRAFRENAEKRVFNAQKAAKGQTVDCWL